MPVVSQLQYTTATIAASGTTSGAACIEGGLLVEIQFPGTMTGTATSIQTSMDGVTFQALYGETNSAISMTTAASRNYNVTAFGIYANYIKLVSGSTESANRVIGLVYKMVGRC